MIKNLTVVATVSLVILSCFLSKPSFGIGRTHKMVVISLAETPHYISGGSMSSSIKRRYADATILTKADFDNIIVRNKFRYREVGSSILIERPAEVFYEDGRYSVGHRTIVQGGYHFDDTVVKIDCMKCTNLFLGLSNNRIFFVEDGSIFMTSADKNEKTIELIRYNN